MNKLKERLIKIADILDEQGLEEEADLIDSLTYESSEDDVIEIPDDEASMLEDILDGLKESLSNKDKEVAVEDNLDDEIGPITSVEETL